MHRSCRRSSTTPSAFMRKNAPVKNPSISSRDEIGSAPSKPHTISNRRKNRSLRSNSDWRQSGRRQNRCFANLGYAPEINKRSVRVDRPLTNTLEAWAADLAVAIAQDLWPDQRRAVPHSEEAVRFAATRIRIFQVIMEQ